MLFLRTLKASAAPFLLPQLMCSAAPSPAAHACGWQGNREERMERAEPMRRAGWAQIEVSQWKPVQEGLFSTPPSVLPCSALPLLSLYCLTKLKQSAGSNQNRDLWHWINLLSLSPSLFLFLWPLLFPTVPRMCGASVQGSLASGHFRALRKAVE